MSRSKDDEDLREQIRREIEEETRTSRYREHVRGRSHGRRRGERVHPTRHHVDAVMDFAWRRRSRHPETYDLMKRVMQRGPFKVADHAALCRLVEIILRGGATNASIHRSCAYALDECAAFAVLRALHAFMAMLQGQLRGLEEAMSENEEEKKVMTETEVRSSCRAKLAQMFGELTNPETVEQVLATEATIPFDGDPDAYLAAVMEHLKPRVDVLVQAHAEALQFEMFRATPTPETIH
jgi:hypothetical protein